MTWSAPVAVRVVTTDVLDLGRVARGVSPDLELALELADAADAISLPRFRTGLAVETKPDLTPVTEADRMVESELRRLSRGATARRCNPGRGGGRERAGSTPLDRRPDRRNP